MISQLTRQQRYDLEEMIDRTSLETVIKAIAVICTDKGGDLRTAWQDVPSARQWEAAATKLMNLAATQTVKNVSRWN
jgi:hypothetical protein